METVCSLNKAKCPKCGGKMKVRIDWIETQDGYTHITSLHLLFTCIKCGYKTENAKDVKPKAI